MLDIDGIAATASAQPPANLPRYGKFTAPAAWAREFRTELKRVMGQCIVVRAEQMFIRDQIEYYAISEHFRPVTPGEIAPEYRWMFSDDGHMWCEEVPPYAAAAPQTAEAVIEQDIRRNLEPRPDSMLSGTGHK